MASIDDYVSHRWEDAKEALRKLDGEFVNPTNPKSVTTVSLLNLGHPSESSGGLTINKGVGVGSGVG